MTTQMKDSEDSGTGTTFICYARRNWAFVRQLAEHLLKLGAPVWLDQWNIPSGDDWDRAIEDAIRDCAACLVVLSPDSVDSREVRGELRIALDLKKPILPVLYESCEMPRQMRLLQYVDLRETTDLAAAAATVWQAIQQVQDAPLPKDVTPSGERPRALDLRLHRTRYTNYLLVNPATSPVSAQIPKHSYVHTNLGIVGSAAPLEGVKADADGHLPHLPDSEILVDFTLTGRGPTAMISQIELQILGHGDLPVEAKPGTFRPVLEPIEESVVLRTDQTRYPLFRDVSMALKGGEVDLLRVDVIVADEEGPGWYAFCFVVTYAAGGAEEQVESEPLYLVKSCYGQTPRIPVAKRPLRASSAASQPEAAELGLAEAWAQASEVARQRPDFWMGPRHRDALLDLAEDSGPPPTDDLKHLKTAFYKTVMEGPRSPLQRFGYEPVPWRTPGGSVMQPVFVPVNPSHGKGYSSTVVGEFIVYQYRDTPEYRRLLGSCYRLSSASPATREAAVSFLLSQLSKAGARPGWWGALFGRRSDLDVAGVVDTLTLLSFLPTKESCRAMLYFLKVERDVVSHHVACIFNRIRYRAAGHDLLRLAIGPESYAMLPSLASLRLNGEAEFFDAILGAWQSKVLPLRTLDTVALVLLDLNAERAEEWAHQHVNDQAEPKHRLAFEILNALQAGPDSDEAPTKGDGDDGDYKARFVTLWRPTGEVDESGEPVRVLCIEPEAEVLAELREVVAKYRTLAKTDSEAMPALAAAWADLGAMLAERRYIDEGLEAMHQAVETYNTLANQHLPLREEVGDRAGLAATLNNIGLVYHGLGDRQQALTYSHKALPLREEVGDRAGLAATLNNIGLVYHGLGDRQQALTYFHKALPLGEEVGDRAVERVTRYNLAMLYRAQGQLAEAVAALRQVVALDTQVQHPDLESDQAMLRQLEQEWRESLQ
jgi:tetratricopeptide (TPR) repeat protein